MQVPRSPAFAVVVPQRCARLEDEATLALAPCTGRTRMAAGSREPAKSVLGSFHGEPTPTHTWKSHFMACLLVCFGTFACQVRRLVQDAPLGAVYFGSLFMTRRLPPTAANDHVVTAARQALQLSSLHTEAFLVPSEFAQFVRFLFSGSLIYHETTSLTAAW